MLRYSAMQSGAAGDPALWILPLSKDSPVIGKRLRKSMPRLMVTLQCAKLASTLGGDSGLFDAEGPPAHPATLVKVSHLRPSIRVRHTEELAQRSALSMLPVQLKRLTTHAFSGPRPRQTPNGPANRHRSLPPMQWIHL
jgi:hypothetical protein